MNAAPVSRIGDPPASAFPPPPARSSWQAIPHASIPAGIVFAAPVYVARDAQNIYARALVPTQKGGAYLLIRAFPLAQQFRTRIDYFYYAAPQKMPRSFGAPPDEAGHAWQPWEGELPSPVAVAFATQARPGQDFRATIAGQTWAIRSDVRGASVCSLGAPPNDRRRTVSAWRLVPAPASAPRPQLRAVAYLGQPSAPWPPAPDGWAETTPDPDTCRELLPSLLGELPVSHYADAMTRSGLYRFFAYETGAGQKAIGSLRFWGSTLGAPASTLGDTPGDLATFNGQAAAGDSAMAAGSWSSAVQSYQAAGNTGATLLGPDIDAQTGGVSQPVTQQAWAINTNLATIPSDASAGQQDAQNAQGLLGQMRALYEQAIAMSPPAPAPGPAPSGGSSAANVAAAGAAASTLVAYFSTHACSQNAIPQCSAFQTAYNASAIGASVTVDGKYGPLTQAALQLVLDFTHGGAGAGGQAPANCFTGHPAPAPSTNPPAGGGPSAAPTSAPTTVQTAAMSSTTKVAIALGVVATVGALGWAAATGNLPSLTTSPA